MTEQQKEKHRLYMRKWCAANPGRWRAINRKSVNKTRDARNSRQRAFNKANPEIVRERRRRFKEKHPDRLRELKRASYRRHKRHHIQKCKEWARRNPEKVKAIKVAWKKRNPEAVRASAIRCLSRTRISSAAWAKKNPEKVRESVNRRRARRVSATIEDCTGKIALLRKITRFCHWCCLPLKPDTVTIDHVIPLFRGGKHGPENLVGACLFCNSSKGTKLVHEWTWKAAA